MKTKKVGRGGEREGSGRPRQFEEPITINFKAEKSDVEAAKEKFGKSLNKMFAEWLRSVVE